ncbi:fructosamine kinase PKL/CAK/FruK [Dichomitus squalens LYAD-421 SS1]|uniref:fructosamine kinase PKL/CAK/FruK n=1 Tax=Dichomitus squalens (strain LYAD-421) TaxID=732165 RepID=UPI00044151EB|nr:fructosamine kinase PKL/CAK/FruK [Dichomitus squalens LYAD-421 SS1]EJF66845.1 fructosamine kinase PKL/CAK/FruK [Dichomitus squalens LYAD-421 SS1]
MPTACSPKFWKGSSLESAYRRSQHYFAKIGRPDDKDRFVGEAESLKAMYAAAPGLVPRLLSCGVIDNENKERDVDVGRPYFLSEYKDIGPLSSSAAKILGKRVATELHAYESKDRYGFHVPTYCGATRQDNGWFNTWPECFDALIGGLVEKLKAQGGYESLCEQVEKVRERVIPALLDPLDILPVLLHGDLWSGNTGIDRSTGEPVIFDPSSYYGHNEADLAIGRMFGGIPESFYTTYHEYLPKSEPREEYGLRQDLYQLYHYLNHTVLFGGGYAGSARSKMDKLLRTIPGAEK